MLVRNVPPDVTIEDLIEHFSKLYPLDKPDWYRRPPIEGAEKVKFFDNSGISAHLDSWVADCNIHRKIGVFILAFKEKQSLMERMYRQRALMKVSTLITVLSNLLLVP